MEGELIVEVRRERAYPFDEPGRVLAHAFFPPDGRANFDEDEHYNDGTPSGTNLLWFATHEFGHALGIHHSDVRNAVMYRLLHWLYAEP